MSKALYAYMALVLLAIPLLVAGLGSTSGVGYQVDFPHARVIVLEVLEDLSLRITPPVYVGGVYRHFVKLADVSPLAGAREALLRLLSEQGNIVYLDLDTATIEDGRAVAVVYVRLNKTHIMNINKWLVDTGYASVDDKPNVFDPTKWVLHFIYPVEYEKLPSITRVIICESCTISNATTWGVNVKTSVDRAHLAVVYTLDETPQRLRIAILDSTGYIVRHEVLENTSVVLGYVDIAVNETGFFVTWRDLTIGPNRARCGFIPVDPTLPVNVSDRVFGGGGSWHSSPIAAWNPFNESWVVIYVHQTMAWRPRYFINFVNRAGLPAGGTGAIWLSPPGGTNRTGIDIQGRLIYDHVSRNFAFVSRNETVPGEFNIEVIIFPADKPAPLSEVVDVFRVYIDDRPGPQGPEPSMFNASFAYFNLYPSIYSSLLGTGRYLLVVYNDTSRSLAYAIVDLVERTVLVRDTLVDVGVDTTFYPWISGGGYWLVTWSASGVVNASLVANATPYVLGTFTVSSAHSDRARVIYDSPAGIHAIAFLVARSGVDQGIYMVFLREATGRIEPWILPVTVQPVSLVPINLVALRGSSETSSTLGLVALEGSNLVLYLVNYTYPELLSPAKGATPVETPTPTPIETPETPPGNVTTVTVTETVTVTVTQVVTRTVTTTVTTVVERTVTVERPVTVTTTTTMVVEKTTTVYEVLEEVETVTETVYRTTTLRDTVTEVRTLVQTTTVKPPEAEYATVVLGVGVVALVASAIITYLARRRS